MRNFRSGLVWLLLGTAACAAESGSGPSAARVTASAGDDQIGGAGQTLVAALEVTVTDVSGNPVPGIAVAWAAREGGSVDPATGFTGSDGTATARRTLGPTAGVQTTTATVAGLAPVVFTHTAQIQGATQIAAAAETVRSDSVNSTVPFTAVVRDQNGAPVPGVVVSWAATGGGTLSRTQDTTDAAGFSRVDLTLARSAGRQTAQAAVTGLIGSPVSFTDDATAGNATQLFMVAGDFQVGPVLTGLPVQHSVTVRDAYGNPKPGVSVRWAVGDGGGLVNGAGAVTIETNALGVAAATRTLGSTAGPHSDTAAVPGVAGSPVVFSDTAGALVTIQVGNDFFKPQLDTVPAGSFLKFVWVSGGNLHNVTWDPADPAPVPANSSNESALNATFTVRLPGAGTYGYHCAYHGGVGTGAFGVIVTR